MSGQVNPLKRLHTVLYEELCCPVCYDSIQPPVWQCENGHVTCQACNFKSKMRCGLCRRSCDTRNIFAEKLLKRAFAWCPYGCGCKYSYEKDAHHRDTCRKRPFFCPLTCAWSGGKEEDLLSHLREGHGARSARLEERGGGWLATAVLEADMIGGDEERWVVTFQEGGKTAGIVALVRKGTGNDFKATLLVEEKELDATLCIRVGEGTHMVRRKEWKEMRTRNVEVAEFLDDDHSVRTRPLSSQPNIDLYIHSPPSFFTLKGRADPPLDSLPPTIRLTTPSPSRSPSEETSEEED